MIAAVSSTILYCRVRAFPNIRAAAELKRCFSSCEDDNSLMRRMEKKHGIPEPPMKKAERWETIWENPECCKECEEPLRHDLVYLKKKPKRVYTRTWNECEGACKSRYVCVGEILPPEREYRPRRVSVMSGGKKPCVGDESHLDLMRCQRTINLKVPCPRLRMPGCPVVRVPPYCDPVSDPKCCQKRCTKYPSYSECDKPKPKVEHPVECACLKIPSKCEIFEMFRKFAVK